MTQCKNHTLKADNTGSSRATAFNRTNIDRVQFWWNWHWDSSMGSEWCCSTGNMTCWMNSPRGKKGDNRNLHVCKHLAVSRHLFSSFMSKVPWHSAVWCTSWKPWLSQQFLEWLDDWLYVYDTWGEHSVLDCILLMDNHDSHCTHDAVL